VPEVAVAAAAAVAPAGGQRAVLEAARDLRAASRAFALALVTEAEGSTYRKPGALALVTEDGRRVGVISGGCLESGLVALAASALAAAEPCDTVFDTRSEDDLVFGSGTGCRGRMRVLVLPVLPDRPSPVLEALLAAHEARRPLVLSMAEVAPSLSTCNPVIVKPSPLLLLLGAGPEAPPLLAIARTLGWFAWVADHRDGLLDGQRLRHADRVLRGRPDTVLGSLAGERIDAALVMTHLAHEDLAALQSLSSREVPYVGLLGPPARRDELVARLDAPERLALDGRLRAPAGLPLGGEGPEAIALAIAADLQRVFNAPAIRRADPPG
jgi:xanthine dehydrogenase accessory factor